MRHGTRFVAILGSLLLRGCAAPFPIKDEQAAITLARALCASRVAAEPYRGAMVWKAILWGDEWQVSQTPADESRNPHAFNLFIDIPVAGPAPKDCNLSFSDGI